MLSPDQTLHLDLTVAEVNVVMTALNEAAMPFRVSAPVIDRIRQQVLAVDPNAFSPPAAAVNGSGEPAPPA
jgi:hypothetical protein